MRTLTPNTVTKPTRAEKTALAWEQEGAQAAEHFGQIKALLDAEDKSYLE